MHKSNYISTLWWSPESPKAHAQPHFLLFFIMCCVLHCLKSRIFVGGGGISRESWFCGGWTTTLGLCAYQCGITFTGLWLLPFQCGALLTTGSKDLKYVGVYVCTHLWACVQVCVWKPEVNRECCSPWHCLPCSFEIEAPIDLEFTKWDTGLVIQKKKNKKPTVSASPTSPCLSFVCGSG